LISPVAPWYGAGMPRGARLDAPEALHHVVVRGTERSRLCHEHRDCADFVARLAGVVGRTGLAVLAWALLPNHLHLLVRTPAAQGRRPEFQGGGLRRSAGGWTEVAAFRRGREGWAADERILGSGMFVEAVLREAGPPKATWPRSRALAVTPAVVQRGVERGPAVLATRQIGVEDAVRAGGRRMRSPVLRAPLLKSRD